MNFLKDLIFKNLALKIVALFLGVILWVVVISLQNPKGNRFFLVRLEVENLDPDLTFKEAPLDFVILEVRGQMEIMSGLGLQRMRAYIDLRRAKIGTSVYDVIVDQDTIPAEVEIVEWTPTRIGLTLERRINPVIAK